MLIILSAPSGCGKTTVAAQLVAQMPKLVRVVTCTTRERREGEVEGRDYFFLSEQDFRTKIEANEFMEWAKVHNHYYGTLKATLDAITQRGNTPLLVIDVQGEATWKKLVPHAISIFIKPESMSVLREWLTKREEDTAEDIELRLHNAESEIAQAPHYDYQIINKNGHLEETVDALQTIIKQILQLH